MIELSRRRILEKVSPTIALISFATIKVLFELGESRREVEELVPHRGPLVVD